MDVTQSLKDTENSLRDFISYILNERFGTDWEQKCGVSDDRLNKWKERKLSEAKRQKAGAQDERLIYYADFYDLKTILKKHWNLFSETFGDQKVIDVWLTEIEKLRDPDAHRRELLPHQKSLVLGISGELRTKIARYRSSKETAEAYYPRIEFASDNLGNTWKLGDVDWVRTGMILRPGDLLEYVVTASDPLEEPLLYQCNFSVGSPGHSDKWLKTNSFSFGLTDKYIGKLFFASISIKSNRKYHSHNTYDDEVMFTYEVLPPR